MPTDMPLSYQLARNKDYESSEGKGPLARSEFGKSPLHAFLAVLEQSLSWDSFSFDRYRLPRISWDDWYFASLFPPRSRSLAV